MIRRPADALQPPLWTARFDQPATHVALFPGEDLVGHQSGRATVVNPVRYPLDQILLMYHLARNDGVIVHAAGADLGGKGLIFAGKSGAGKSTLSRLVMAEHAQAVEMLSDDRMVVRKIEGAFWAYGTPWPGDAGIAVDKSMPLRAMLFLHRGDGNEIRDLTPQRALEQLLPVASIPWYDREVLPDVLDFCDELITNVPAYELHFRPEPEVVDLLESFAAGL